MTMNQIRKTLMPRYRLYDTSASSTGGRVGLSAITGVNKDAKTECAEIGSSVLFFTEFSLPNAQCFSSVRKTEMTELLSCSLYVKTFLRLLLSGLVLDTIRA